MNDFTDFYKTVKHKLLLGAFCTVLLQQNKKQLKIMQCELATFILCKNGQRIEDEVTDNEKNNSYQDIKSCRNKGYQSPERYLFNE